MQTFGAQLCVYIPCQLSGLVRRSYIFCCGTYVIRPGYLPLRFHVPHLFIGDLSWQETLEPHTGHGPVIKSSHICNDGAVSISGCVYGTYMDALGMSDLLVTTHQHKRSMTTGVQLARRVHEHTTGPPAITFKSNSHLATWHLLLVIK